MSDHRATGRKNGEARRWHSRRVRALLACGLVLGIGATITLAAWNSSEFAQGTFSAGTFSLVGSTDGTAFASNSSVDSPATLGFTANVSDLAPSDTAYAPFAVELAAGTTDSAVVTLTNAATSGTISNLTYSLIEPSSFGCSSSTTGTTLVAAGTALGSVPGTVTFDLAPGTGGAAGAPVDLCFEVTAGSGLVQGQTGTTTWQFQGVSQ